MLKSNCDSECTIMKQFVALLLGALLWLVDGTKHRKWIMFDKTAMVYLYIGGVFAVAVSKQSLRLLSNTTFPQIHTYMLTAKHIAYHCQILHKIHICTHVCVHVCVWYCARLLLFVILALLGNDTSIMKSFSTWTLSWQDTACRSHFQAIHDTG